MGGWEDDRQHKGLTQGVIFPRLLAIPPNIPPWRMFGVPEQIALPPRDTTPWGASILGHNPRGFHIFCMYVRHYCSCRMHTPDAYPKTHAAKKHKNLRFLPRLDDFLIAAISLLTTPSFPSRLLYPPQLPLLLPPSPPPPPPLLYIVT